MNAGQSVTISRDTAGRSSSASQPRPCLARQLPVWSWLVAAARASREVAGAPVISVKTVDSSLSRIYRKPGVRSGTELARKLPAKNDPAPAC
jgi:DNA-binding NarL/FixJ family response regulator